MKSKHTAKQKDPVSDGDTRPDHQDVKKDQIRKPDLVVKKDDEKITKERAADTNSLEDFKDAN